MGGFKHTLHFGPVFYAGNVDSAKAGLCSVGRKVEVLEVLRSFGDIFSQKLRLLRRKKHVKMASIRILCD